MNVTNAFRAQGYDDIESEAHHLRRKRAYARHDCNHASIDLVHWRQGAGAPGPWR